MDKNTLKNYLNRLKDFESQLNDNKADMSTIDQLNELLSELNNSSVATQNINLNLEVGFLKLHKDAIIPSYSKPGDAGMDLTITEIKNDTEKEVTYGYGLAIEIPDGYVGLIFPRSSVRKYDLTLSNCVGVIDSGYRGEIMSTFKKLNHDNIIYKKGERAAQILILPYPKIQPVEKKELSKTERSDGGFGHTGI